MKVCLQDRWSFRSFGFASLLLGFGLTLLIGGCAGGGSGSGSGGGGNTTPTPAISSISPTSVAAGSAALTLTVNGSGFETSSVVQVGGSAEATTYVSATQLTASVPASQITNSGELPVAVVNGSDISTGATVNLEVDDAAPTITSIAPTSEIAGTPSATVVVTGTGFVPLTVIDVNGTARVTGYTSATQVSVILTAADLTNAGSLALTAVNPAPGGGTSAAASLSVVAAQPVPQIGSVTPDFIYAGSSNTTITVLGSNFSANSVVQWNGTALQTTAGTSTSLTATVPAADLTAAGTASLTVETPGTNPVTSTPAIVTILTAPTPQLGSVNPTSIYTDSGDTTLTVYGSNFTPNSVVEWNGTALQTSEIGGYLLSTTVPASDLTAAGTVSVTVDTPGASPATSNAATVTITNPPVPTVTSLYPNAGPIGTASQVTLGGTGFAPSTTVAVNGVEIASTYVSSTEITATIPASNLGVPGNVSVTVTTPSPGGGTSSAEYYTVYLPIAANDIVFNSTDGLLYASVAVAGAGLAGNEVVGIDPTTGNVTRQIWVGSNPNKLALSTNGTQLFVGLDGSAAVAQVNLTQGKVVNQFPLVGGSSPLTALYLAAVPGLPNSVAVATQTTYNGPGGVILYDSGVARADSWTTGTGPMSFGSSASTLYVVSGSTVEDLTVGSTGITAETALTSANQQITWLQYDSGRLYLSSGQVLNASTGALLGTFYSGTSTPAIGPIVSDSSLGRAFIASSSYTTSDEILAFDESSFDNLGSITVNLGNSDYPNTFGKIVRWGQNGLALSSATSPYSVTPAQMFIFQSPVVKDLSSSPADLSVTLKAPSAATTGNSATWTVKVDNLGPNVSDGVTVAINLDPSLAIGSVKATQGSCGSGATFSCDLGRFISGGSVTVTVDATPTAAGTLASSAMVNSESYDPTPSNNQATASTTVTGAAYNAVPTLSSLSPNLVQAGSSDFTLTVNGNGFNGNSTVNLGSSALATTFVSATQLTADVTAAEIATYGWAPVTVSTPSPGGGVSQAQPLTIFDLVNAPANALLFDPYSQMLYATVPSTSTTVTGDSVVSIDPVTGVVGTPVAVGSQPTVMAETADGNDLYIGLSGADSLARFNLLTQKLTATIPLTLKQGTSTTPVTATSLAAMPGTDTTLAVGVNNVWGSFGILDISGATGSFRTNLSGIYEGTGPVFADASHLYAVGSNSLYRYSVDASGLMETDGTNLNGLGGYGSFQFGDGTVFGTGGGIIDPSTTPPSQIATLPLVDFAGTGGTPEGSGVAADPSLGKDFLMLENVAGEDAYGLTRYDLTTYLPEAVLAIPATFSSINSGWTMLRWGQDGLALMASTEDYGTDQTTSTIVLLRGPFVAPQEMGTSTAASLTGSSSSTITHGSGNTVLTLTGTNFLPGVAVTWNGSYRTTTIVDGSHVTVAIPASDLAAAGSASVVATNPGATASNTLTITID